MNKVKKLNKTILVEQMPDEEEDIPYDEDWDIKLQTAHEEVMAELQKLKVTRSWPQAKIFELYWMSSDTLDEVSKKIGKVYSINFSARSIAFSGSLFFISSKSFCIESNVLLTARAIVNFICSVLLLTAPNGLPFLFILVSPLTNAIVFYCIYLL